MPLSVMTSSHGHDRGQSRGRSRGQSRGQSRGHGHGSVTIVYMTALPVAGALQDAQE